MTFVRSVRAIVVDASAMVDVAIGNPSSLGRFATWQDAGALLLAPPHFGVEVANALLRGARLEAQDVAARLDALFRAGVEVADRGVPGLVDATDLAARHDLTVYDAAYLALALDVDGELATGDGALAHAARREGLPVLD
jgi:predicted nucleic acid-binding protein